MNGFVPLDVIIGDPVLPTVYDSPAFWVIAAFVVLVAAAAVYNIIRNRRNRK